MVDGLDPAVTRPAGRPFRPAIPARPGRPGTVLLVAGILAFAAVLGSYLVYMFGHPYHWTLDPVDLGVYQSGGLIVRHVQPPYDPHLAAPLYQWPGTSLHLKFTYTPFAAVVFALVSFIPWHWLPGIEVVVNIAALLAALWFTFGGLGYRAGRARAGATLLTAAAVFWTEPVLRTLYLGQVNLVLMALIIWDLCQPDTRASRWWKGAGVGIAAGIKLVPLIFIPYLLLTRRFRQAVVAAGAFLVSVAVGFALLPADSDRWWLHGLFFNGGRTGFVGWEGNQSLRALLTRLIGSVSGAGPAWLVAAAITVAAGLACTVVLDRAGHQMAGILAGALTGLLVSPVSWDHHWVWIVPGVAVLATYAVRAWRGVPRRILLACFYGVVAAGLLVVYGGWPGRLWGEPRDLGPFSLGVIWQPPNTNPETYYKHGDLPRYREYHWHGIELLTGNAYLAGGLAMLALLIAAAVYCYGRSPAGPDRPGPGETTGGQPPVLREVG